MSFTPHDEISLRHNEVSDKKLLVFFITGNPGLIGYYQTFLTLCYDSLRPKYKDHSIHVFGTSLAGFGIATEEKHAGPLDLEEQIQYIDQTLTRQVSSIRSKASSTTDPTRVILIGHSVGSYILLEVLRRQKARHDKTLKIISGICLFPTVTHIAKSPSGKRISLLFNIPYLPLMAGVLVSALFSWWPSRVLQQLVALVTGMPPESAQVTTAFLQTRGCVRQALYLAQHEMRTITADKWDDEIWGAVTDDAMPSERTKLFFLFGTDDHWVADETRDDLIAARAAKGEVGEEGKPSMEIDESGIPHGFCIKHNEPVARKVVDYMDESVRNLW